MKDQVVAFLQRHPGVFVIAAVLALGGVSLMVGVGGPLGGGSSDDEGGGTTTTVDDGDENATGDRGREDGVPESSDGSAVIGDSADVTGAGSASSETTADVPTDVDQDRDPVDLATEPPGHDDVEVARWWAASYTAHIGAEPTDDLVERLAGYTTGSLAAELNELPPPATYTEPLTVEGVSVGNPWRDESADDEGHVLRVTVETPHALAIYDLTLEQDGDHWRVAEVVAL